MRRGSSTTIVLVGEDTDPLLADLARSPNVSVVVAGDGGLDAAVAALAEAVGRVVPFAMVGVDPLAGVAEQWRLMWDLSGTEDAFEERAGEVLAAWRAGRFDLPDYYLVMAEEHTAAGSPHPRDLHLGVLHNVRPARVVPVSPGQTGEVGPRVLRALRGLRPGPWWPPLDRLLDEARSFYPGHVSAGPAAASPGSGTGAPEPGGVS